MAKPMETGNNEHLCGPNGGARVLEVFAVRFQQTGHWGKVWSSSCISMNLLRSQMGIQGPGMAVSTPELGRWLSG